ncbi:NADH-ubiquinone oxidoreductase chain J [hydrothermal vent metagenome]|uniref:NADH-ubiquinone oxidoreductase chain J n=1 Tax=hydrothermal vent metagenome TaxID=652676 RepID=A0A1W1EBJ5_9ZZZZ
MLEISIFGILAAFTLGGSIAMISNKQPVFSAFGFLVAMIGLAGMFALLNSQFLALAQVMVAVGAIVVLSMLTILTVNAKDENLPKEPNKFKWIIFTSVIITPFTVLIYKILSTLPNKFSDLETIDSKIAGSVLFSDWIFPFEILSILLLTAMIAAIVISRKDTCDVPASTKRRRRL